MGLFSPEWQSEDEARAISALGQLNTETLLDIALLQSKQASKWYRRTACAYRVRRSAVSRITDESLLITVVQSRTDTDIRETALRQVKDKVFLSDYAKSGKNELRLRLCAVSCLQGDEETLFDLAANAGDGTVRLQAAGMLNEEEHIAEALKRVRIFRQEEQPAVLALFKKLNDLARLDVCVSTKDEHIREIGEAMLSDRPLLVELARKTGYFSIKNAWVLKNLTQEELYSCYTKAYAFEKLSSIFDYLNDPALLFKAADDEKLHFREFGKQVIEKAISRISDAELVDREIVSRHARFAVNETSAVLEELLKKTDDQDVLARVAVNTNVSSLCKIIAGKLTNVELLRGVAKNCRSLELFKTLVPSIQDPMLLAYIICNEQMIVFGFGGCTTSVDPCAHIRFAARERLQTLPDNGEALSYIARHEGKKNG